MATDAIVRTIRAEYAGDLSLRLPDGHATVSVDPAAHSVTVTLRPAPSDPRGPRTPKAVARRVIAAASAVEGPGLLAVDVSATAPVLAEIVLPSLGHLVFCSRTADLAAERRIDVLEFRSATGSLDADHVAILKAATTTGKIQVRTLSEVAVVRTQGGEVQIGQYAGRRLDVLAGSGRIAVHAERTATGSLDLRTAGRIELTGHHKHLQRPADAEAVPSVV